MTFSLLFASQGFGFNLNIFETNVINLAIVIFGLYKFLPGFLGGILERRRNAILSDLQEAEESLLLISLGAVFALSVTLLVVTIQMVARSLFWTVLQQACRQTKIHKFSDFYTFFKSPSKTPIFTKEFS